MGRKQNMERWSSVAVSNGKTKDIVTVKTVETPEKVQTVVSLNDEELEHRKRANQVELDLRIARSYNSKNDDARNRNLQFSLTLGDWVQLMTVPVCQYSGKTLYLSRWL